MTVDGRLLRQRCAWCAHILIDEDIFDQRPAFGRAPRVPQAWPLGTWVASADGETWQAVPTAVNMAPPGACTEIPAELTIAYQPEPTLGQ